MNQTNLEILGNAIVGDLEKTSVFGLPLNPRHLLEELAGASFCVSYATRDKLGSQLDDAIRLVGQDGILLVDNGAFSMHKQGISTRDESYQEAYEIWAQEILDRCPQAIAVLPDVIGGTEAENAELINTSMLDYDRAMPIWHMHESLDYLLHLCEGFGYIGIGSSGEYWQVGSPAWHARIAEMFAAIDAWEATSCGAFIRPRIHMMRAQSMAHLYPFDSSDSTNVAMNHGRYRDQGEGYVAAFAARATAKIAASSGAEAEHQEKRPLLAHVEMAAWREAMELEQLKEAIDEGWGFQPATWDEAFAFVSRKKVGGGGKTIGADETVFAGQGGWCDLQVVSRVRLIDPMESFYTSSGHRLRDSKVGDAGHWVDLKVKGACSDDELELIRSLAQAVDTRPVEVRRAA